MICSQCQVNVETNQRFCSYCGSPLLALDRCGSGMGRPLDDRVKRIFAAAIDMLPVVALSVIHVIPIVGWLLFAGVASCYWLFRDLGGASIGKLVLGLTVTNRVRTESASWQRIIRNLPLSIPHWFGLLPLIGLPISIAMSIFVLLIEFLLLTATGIRFGDLFAGTRVCPKKTEPAAHLIEQSL